MRILKLLFMPLLINIIVTSVVSGQSIEEYHKKLSDVHSKIIKQDDAINSGNVKDYKKAAEDVGVQLEEAKKYYADIEKKLTTAQKEKTYGQQQTIKQNYDKAAEYYKTMINEASKANPNKAMLKEQSKLINSQIKEAERHHEKMKEILK